jgi:hypothetical protein
MKPYARFEKIATVPSIVVVLLFLAIACDLTSGPRYVAGVRDAFGA